LSKQSRIFLITGGAGFVGYHLAKKILQGVDNQVVLVDNFRRGRRDKELSMLLDEDRVQLIEGDLSSQKVINELPEANVVFHLAAMVGVQHVVRAPAEVLKINALATFNCLEYARRLSNCERFVFSSTSEVYAGTLEQYGMDIPTPETTPIVFGGLNKPRLTYALSKVMGEAAVLMETASNDLPTTIIRYHNIYGPRMGFSHVVPEMIRKCSLETRVEVASPDHTRAFCFIDDAVEATLALSEKPEAVGETFNVGNSLEEIKIWELARKIRKICGTEVEMKRGNVTPGSPERRCPDISKLSQCTGFVPVVGLHQGLCQTFDWYVQNLREGTS
jgi:UDP-glucose 4-epimerase